MTSPFASSSAGRADTIVIGAGLIGLACAEALARAGRRVLLMVDQRRGEASAASAGVLGPSLDRGRGPAHNFALASRDMYPAWLAALRERTRLDIPLDTSGILQVALTEREAEEMSLVRRDESPWLARADLEALEPGLRHAFGALHHLRDGAVNTLVLLRALKTAVGLDPAVQILSEGVRSLAFDSGGVTVVSEQGSHYLAEHVVVAAGAWGTLIDGLPRPIPVTPLRGQMLSLAGTPVRHITFGGRGYIVPRPDGRTLAGATEEDVGFDPDTTEDGMKAVRAMSERICPALGSARPLHGWAGLRPVTPDLRPIIGRDPAEPSLIYACGHSKNGVLLAPLTGECVASLITGSPRPADLAPFDILRFAASAPPVSDPY